MAASRSLRTQDLVKFTFPFTDFETLVEPLFKRLVEEGRFDKVHSNRHWQTVGRRKGDKTNVRYTPLDGTSLGRSLYGASNLLLRGMRSDYENGAHSLKLQISALENGLNDAATVLANDETSQFDRQKLQERVSFIYTLMRSLGKEHAQSPHFDFSYELLEQFAGQLLLVFFPLTLDGCQLQVWTTGVPDEGNDVRHGVLYTIPYGSFLILPPGSIHGGGFSSNQETGNPRMHVYVVTGDADFSQNDFSNEHFSKHTNLLLSLRFQNDPCFHPQVPLPVEKKRPSPTGTPAVSIKSTMGKRRHPPPSGSNRRCDRAKAKAVTPKSSRQSGQRAIGSRSSLRLQSAAYSLLARADPISPYIAPLPAEASSEMVKDLDATLLAAAILSRGKTAVSLETTVTKGVEMGSDGGSER